MAEHLPDDYPASPIRICIGKGDDIETGSGSFSFVQHSDVPLSVGRPPAWPRLVVISADADEDGGDGVSMHMTEDMARRLVADLTAVLDDPHHRPPLD